MREHPTVRRPLTVRRVDAPLPTFVRLLDELPYTADVVKGLGAGAYHIEGLGPGRFRIDDGHGARADVERIASVPGARIYLAKGGMEVPMLPTVHGLGVITLRYDAVGDATLTGGQIYFRLSSRVLHAVVHTIVPLLYGAIDRKIGKLTEAALAACRHVAGDERGEGA